MERFRQPQHYRSPDSTVQEIKQKPTEFLLNILICPLCGEPIPGNRDTASHKCGEVSAYLSEASMDWRLEGEYERRVEEVGGRDVVERMGRFKAFLATEVQKGREAAPVGVSGSSKISFMTAEEAEAMMKAKETSVQTESLEEKEEKEKREGVNEQVNADLFNTRKRKPIIE